LSKKPRAFFSPMVSVCHVAILAGPDLRQPTPEARLELEERSQLRASRAQQEPKQLERRAPELPEPESKQLEPKQQG
jgi:hypothetical protein